MKVVPACAPGDLCPEIATCLARLPPFLVLRRSQRSVQCCCRRLGRNANPLRLLRVHPSCRANPFLRSVQCLSEQHGPGEPPRYRLGDGDDGARARPGVDQSGGSRIPVRSIGRCFKPIGRGWARALSRSARSRVKDGGHHPVTPRLSSRKLLDASFPLRSKPAVPVLIVKGRLHGGTRRGLDR